MSANINIPPTPGSHRTPQGEHTGFPWMVKYRLTRFFLDRAHSVHATHVVNAVHA
jgi:hypothetical protein